MTLRDKLISKSTVSILKKLLKDAEKGELIGIAFVSIERQGHIDFGWSGAAGKKDLYFTIGSLQRLSQILFIAMMSARCLGSWMPSRSSSTNLPPQLSPSGRYLWP